MTTNARKEEKQQPLDQLIKSHWDDFEVSKSDLQKPTSEFVINFFLKYMQEIESLCNAMFGVYSHTPLGNIMQYCPPEIDQEFFLYVHMQQIFQLINIDYIKLIDFYNPPKRTKTTMRVALNFFLFVRDKVEDDKEFVNDIMVSCNNYNASENALLSLQNEIRERCGEVGLQRVAIENLQQENSEQLKLEVEINEKKAKNDELEEEVMANKNILLRHEEELQKFNNEEIHLQSRYISEDDLKNVLETHQQLKEEIKFIDEQDQEISTAIDQKKRSVDHLVKLSSIVDTIDLSEWSKIEEIELLQKKIESVTISFLTNDLKKCHQIATNKETTVAEAKKNVELETILFQKIALEHQKKIAELEEKLNAERILQENMNTRFKDFINSCKKEKEECYQIEQEIADVMEFNSKSYAEFLDVYLTIHDVFSKSLHKLKEENSDLHLMNSDREFE